MVYFLVRPYRSTANHMCVRETSKLSEMALNRAVASPGVTLSEFYRSVEQARLRLERQKSILKTQEQRLNQTFQVINTLNDFLRVRLKFKCLKRMLLVAAAWIDHRRQDHVTFYTTHVRITTSDDTRVDGCNIRC